MARSSKRNHSRVKVPFQAAVDGNTWTGYIILHVCILYLVPKFGIVSMNAIIISKLRSQLRQHLFISNSVSNSNMLQKVVTITKRNYETQLQQRLKKAKDDEFRMTRLLVIIMIAFTILTTPANALAIIYRLSLSTYKSIDHSITSLANMMLTLNYSLNFYIYCFANR